MAGTDDWSAVIAAECLGRRVRVLDRVISGIYDDALRPHGLKVTQMTLLTALARIGPVPAAELGRRLHLEKSTLSRNLARLRERGWVAARGDPRLTARGRRLIGQAGPAWARAQKDVRAMLGETGAAALHRLVARVEAR